MLGLTEGPALPCGGSGDVSKGLYSAGTGIMVSIDGDSVRTRSSGCIDNPKAMYVGVSLAGLSPRQCSSQPPPGRRNCPQFQPLRSHVGPERESCSGTCGAPAAPCRLP